MFDARSCPVFVLTLAAFGCSQPPAVSVEDAGPRRDAAPDGATPDAFTPDAELLDAGSEDATIPPDSWIEPPSPLPTWAGGVNLSGAEFTSSHIPGTYGTDYVYPSTAHAQHFLDIGMRLFRIPFRWGRLQHELYGELDEAELGRLRTLAAYVTSHGGYAILDPHDYARRGGAFVGSEELPDSALADFWGRVAAEFADDERVWLGLMNEPNGLPATQWLSAANASIAAIREAGADNVVVVPGVRWTGAHSWYSGGDGSNAAVMGGVVDPADNYIYELHQYLDSYSSGTDEGAPCMSETIGRERLMAVTAWLREHGRRAVLGEVAGGDNPTCEAAIDDMLTFMQESSDAWVGYTWWATGPWWGTSYPFSLAPRADGSPAPQEAWLVPHL